MERATTKKHWAGWNGCHHRFLMRLLSRYFSKRSVSNRASDIMLTFLNSYIPKLGPTALVSHTQTSIDSAHLDAGWKKCNTLGDAALESTPNHIC